MKAILVALPLALGPLSYLPPPGEEPRLGHRVAVPFRKGIRVGLVVGEEATPHGHALRHAIGYLDEAPFLDPAGIERLHRAARFLFAPLGQVVADFLPFLEAPLAHEVRLVPGARPEGLDPETRKRLATWQPAQNYPAELLDALREGGVLEERVAEALPERTVLIPLRPPDAGLGPRAREALRVLWQLGEVESQAALARRAGVGSGAVRALLARGYVRVEKRAVLPELTPPPPKEVEPLPLPEPPSRVHGGRFAERMAILKGLAEEGPLLVLFPEAALLERAWAYFPEALPFYGEVPALLRRRFWRERGKTVLGTHQALFFPGTFARVVIVEEGSDAHKLRAGSHAYLPALAEALGMEPLYLGAAPSAHAVFFAQTRKGAAVVLKPPPVRGEAVDKTKTRGMLSGKTLALIGQALARGRQVLVLAARKGYASRLHCAGCGFEPECPNCALPLRYYKEQKGGWLVCHQCGHREPAPKVCPNCGSELIQARGPGLDWIAERLRRNFPKTPVGRLSGELEELPPALAEGEAGILVATTRVLRKNPLKNLALIAIPWVEGFLPEADFGAPERLFFLLWQLRDLVPGKNPYFVLEAYNPEHPALSGFLEGDLAAFPEGELALRKALSYPPFARMVKLELSHRTEEAAREAAGRLAEVLAERVREGELLGPAPAPIPRVKGRYVWHLILKSEEPGRLEALLKDLPPVRPARLRLDPDPVGFSGLLD